LILGALLLFLIDKGDLILFFNDHRSYFGDLFFRYATMLGEEITYLFIFLFLIAYKRRAALLIPITGGVVTIVSKGLKEFFQQDRPIAWFKEMNLYDILNVIEGEPMFSGASSFPSGHTMSGFALFGLLALLISQKKSVALLMLSLALLIGISRVYLIHHFFMDIYAGSIIGALLALIIYSIWFEFQPKEIKP